MPFKYTLRCHLNPRFLCLFLSIWPVLGESGGLKSPNITGLELSSRSNRISFIKLNSPVFGACLLVQLSFDEYEVIFLFYFWLEIILSDIRMATTACLLGLSFSILVPFDDICLVVKEIDVFYSNQLVSIFLWVFGLWTQGEGLSLTQVMVQRHKQSSTALPMGFRPGQEASLTQGNAHRYKGLHSIRRWKLWPQDGDWVWCRLKPTASQVVHTSQLASRPGRMSTLTQGQNLTLRRTLGLHHGSPTTHPTEKNNNLS